MGIQTQPCIRQSHHQLTDVFLEDVGASVSSILAADTLRRLRLSGTFRLARRSAGSRSAGTRHPVGEQARRAWRTHHPEVKASPPSSVVRSAGGGWRPDNVRRSCPLFFVALYNEEKPRAARRTACNTEPFSGARPEEIELLTF